MSSAAPTSYSSLRCRVTEQTSEYQVEVEYHTPTSDAILRRFSVDRSECPKPYVVFLALTDFFEEVPVASPIILYINDLYVYNVLTDYLKRWKESRWFNSQGQPVPYVDILSEFYDTVANHHIGYKVVFTTE